MKLTLNGIKEHEAWENAGIQLPGYDVEKISAKAKKAPVWVHFGIGNIFRIFIGGIAVRLLETENEALAHLNKTEAKVKGTVTIAASSVLHIFPAVHKP